MQKIQKACRYVRNVRTVLRRLSDQARNVHSEEFRDDNADSTDSGVLGGSTAQS